MPGLAAIARHQRIGEVGRLAAGQRILRIHPGGEARTPAQHRLVVPRDQTVLGRGEGDPGIGGALGSARRLGRGGDGFPLLSAIMGSEHRLLGAGNPAVVLIREVDAPRTARHFGQFLPVLTRLLRLPDALFGHHPTDAIVQKEQRKGSLFDAGHAPMRAAIARGHRHRLARSPLFDRADSNPMLRRRELHILQNQLALPLVVGILQLPAQLGRRSGKQGERANGYGGAGG